MVDFFIGTWPKIENGKKNVKQENTLSVNEIKTQQIKPMSRKRAKHKHIECMLLLLTTTPAVHRK